MAIVNTTVQKMSLTLRSSKHQHCSSMFVVVVFVCLFVCFLQVEIVGGFRRTVQPMGVTECCTQTDGWTNKHVMM